MPAGDVIRTVVLVPVCDNDGATFPLALWDDLEARLLGFGAFTQPADVVGVWQFAGRTYRDVSRQYVVSLVSWEHLNRWLEIVRWARVTFKQEALYIEVAGIPEVIGPSPMPADGAEPTVSQRVRTER